MIDQIIEVSDLSPIALSELQKQLLRLGYYNGAVDGIFGKQTGHAFAEWKEDNYLKDHTLIGPDSWAKLKGQSGQVTAIDWQDFNCKISKHFSVREVTNADRRRIPQRDDIRSNVLLLAKELDKIRDDWGSAIGVTSWYRPEPINRAVGGARNSQHITGRAADIYPVQGNIFEFQKWLDGYWGKALGYGAKKGFVHLDLRPGKIRWNY